MEAQVRTNIQHINVELYKIQMTTGTHQHKNMRLGHYFQLIDDQLHMARGEKSKFKAQDPSSLKHAVIQLAAGHQPLLHYTLHTNAVDFCNMVRHRGITLNQKLPPLPVFQIPRELASNQVPLLKYIQWLRKLKRQSINLLIADFFYNYSREGRRNPAARELSPERDKLLHTLLATKKMINKIRRSKKASRPHP